MFREALVALLPRLRRLARMFTRSIADADDLVQLTLERALLRWQQWRPEQRLESWVYAIMRNAWFDELRARRRHGEVPLDEIAEVLAVPEEQAGPLDSIDVERALAALPEEQRAAVLLVLVEGLAYREAAEVLAVPIGTLTSRLARGRMALAAALEGDPAHAGR